MNKKGIIYKTTNLINGKFYIGQDLHNNPNYYGSGKALKLAIEKYGKENFLKETLEECDTKDLLNMREVYWIDKFDAINLGYNIAKGGTGGNTRLGFSEAELDSYNKKNIGRLGKTHNEVTKQKISQSNKEKNKGKQPRLGICHSEESRNQMSQTRIEKGSSKGSNNGMYGKTHSEETKQKMRESRLNRINNVGA
jgi:group I intron endonuclease